MSTEAKKSSPTFSIFECDSTGCRFRFPVHAQETGQSIAESPLSESSLSESSLSKSMSCPLCKETARLVSRFGPSAQHLPPTAETRSDLPMLEVLLDNIRSVWNVGSIFRTADGVGVQHLHLCGITPTPNHPKLAKTALGAETSLPWSYHKNGLDAVKEAKAAGKQIWGLEHTLLSQSLYDWRAAVPSFDSTNVLVLGNEISGIEPEILQMCDQVFHLPMRGTKQSLNVAVAFGIAAYLVRAR